MLRFGIDLGGTKIELCALNAEPPPKRIDLSMAQGFASVGSASARENTGCISSALASPPEAKNKSAVGQYASAAALSEVIHRERVATPAHEYRAIVEAIAGLVERAERTLGEQATVGICTPGAISSETGRIKNSNTRVLNGEALDRDLAQRLGRDVRMENDANCFALSEAIDGAGAGAPVVFGVILGTGVGGGIVVNGRCLVGCNAIAGEWGHIELPYLDAEDRPLPACYCGRKACIETYLSGAGLRAEYQRRGGEPMAASEIASAATAGDPIAVQSLSRYVQRLARGLSVVINVLDPQVIVLGGGLSLMESIYPALPEELPKYVFSDHIATRVLPAVHGDSSGVRGAALLWE